MSLPSKEALEAAKRLYPGKAIGAEHQLKQLLAAAYAIDVAPLRARIAELQNDLKAAHLCKLFDGEKDCTCSNCLMRAAIENQLKAEAERDRLVEVRNLLERVLDTQYSGDGIDKALFKEIEGHKQVFGNRGEKER